MKRVHPSAPPSVEAFDPEQIDALYGLDPVFEPGEGLVESPLAADTPFQSVSCPYCGECFDALIDPSAGSASYIEDCQICCRPIEFALEVDAAGAIVALTAGRSD